MSQSAPGAPPENGPAGPTLYPSRRRVDAMPPGQPARARPSAPRNDTAHEQPLGSAARGRSGEMRRGAARLGRSLAAAAAAGVARHRRSRHPCWRGSSREAPGPPAGLSLRNSRAFSRPWPRCTSPYRSQVPVLSTSLASDRQVEDVALHADAVGMHHVELGHAERRRHLVLHHLHLHPLARRHPRRP